MRELIYMRIIEDVKKYKFILLFLNIKYDFAIVELVYMAPFSKTKRRKSFYLKIDKFLDNIFLRFPR